jgi:pimeloyl-ACP methyl ester carboxylesterase
MARLLVVLLLLCLARPVLAQTLASARFLEGVIGKADYMMQIPEGWDGSRGLVIYAHGYEGEGPGSGTVREPTISGYYEKQGVAWAATGYRSKGYRADWFLDDVRALHDHFVAAHGKPKWTIIHGQSMGGHVAVAALELDPKRFQGAFLECGVIDGVGLVDWLRAYTAAAEYFSGLPLLDTPRPAFNSLIGSPLIEKLGQPGNRTQRGRQFDSVVKHLAGGDVPMREEGLLLRWLANLGPLAASSQAAGEFVRHADTRHIKYDIDAGLGLDATTLNRDIRRITAPSDARPRAGSSAYAPFTGRISAPLMAVHETGDFRVPLRLHQDYRLRTIAAGTSHLLVQRTQRKAGHCGATDTIRHQAFDDLVAWIERGTVPRGEDLLGDVSRLGQ